MSAILGKESGGERIDRGAVCGIGGLRVNSTSSLRLSAYLCVLCVNVAFNAENAENRRGHREIH
jgi:hypothetical protein